MVNQSDSEDEEEENVKKVLEGKLGKDGSKRFLDLKLKINEAKNLNNRVKIFK